MATKPFAKDDTALSWWYILSTAAFLLTAAAGTVLATHFALRLGCSLLTGLLILRLFVIYHDQQHHAILPTSRLAEALMRVFGILVLSPSSVWRSSHNYHHNHNSKLRGSHIGSYPIMTKSQFHKSPRSLQIKYLFMRHPLTILFGYLFMFLYGMTIYPFFNKPREHLDCLASFVLHGVLVAVITWFLGVEALLLALILPFFISQCIGSYLFYAQHNFPGVTFKDNAGWTYERAALDSSSFLRSGKLVAWFTANIGYHHIHHLNARIPFYRLPEALAKIPELQQPKTTSLHPLEIARCLRLKVWDVEAQQMVPLATT